jgi:seryl-tRNA synthetase
MTMMKSLNEYQLELQQAKKDYDKLNKKLKKEKSVYKVEMLREDVEDLRQDIIELQIVINELKQGKTLYQSDSTQFVY